MRNNVGLVPGNGFQGHEYYRTIRVLQANNFEVETISPPWEISYNGLAAHVQQRIDALSGNNPILFGHSYGANLALRSAAKTSRELKGLILASSSLLCANGLRYPQAREFVENDFPGQADAIKQDEIVALATEVNLHQSQIAVLVGEREVKEYPWMGEITRTTAEAFGTEATVVPDAPHFIEYSDAYIIAVAEAVMNIQVANQNP